jgi:SAM-dependent methyltransferase
VPLKDKTVKSPAARRRLKGRDPERNGALARRDRVINERLSALGDDALVINIGCGVVRRFEPVVTCRYLATDIRPLNNVDFSADAAALPVAADSVDLVLALELLEHVPQPLAVLRDIHRVIKPGGTVVISVPSTVPRHDDHDYWRFTAQGLAQLCSEVFEDGEVTVFGGTFEALGYLAQYYASLTFHRMKIRPRHLHQIFPPIGYWLDRHNSWSTSDTALHTLAFDLLFIGTKNAPGMPGVLTADTRPA